MFPIRDYIKEYIGLRHVFPPQFNGHGFPFRDYILASSKLQEGPLCPLWLILKVADMGGFPKLGVLLQAM